MKKLITLFVIIIILSANLTAETYYTCSTSGQNTTNPNGTTGCSASTAWNTAGDTLIVRNGTTLNITTNLNLNGVMVIEDGGSVDLDNSAFGASSDININSGAALIVAGDLLVDAVNGSSININNGGYLEVTPTGDVIIDTDTFFGYAAAANFNVAQGGEAVINGTLATTPAGGANGDIDINGSVSGSGTITAGNGSIGSSQGTGTVNGQSPPFSNPLNVGSSGYEWDGTSWDPSEPNDPGIRAIFTGNYTDPGTAVFGSATIESGVSVTFVDREGMTGVLNDGTMILEDNCAFDSDFELTGSGDIILRRTFNTVGWKHISWPVAGSYTLGDLAVANNKVPFNYTSPKTDQTNIFIWEASSAGWVVPTAATSIVGQPVNMYVFETTATVELTISMSDLNFADLNQSYATVTGGTDPGNAEGGSGWGTAGPTGWNKFVNPFQSYLTINDLDFLDGTTFSSSAYVYDAATGSYKAGVKGGGGSETVIGPNQAFFVQSLGGSGSATIEAADMNGSPAPQPNYFKTGDEYDQVVLQLNGDGYELNTYIAQHDWATDKFDAGYDAYYLKGHAPVFNTVGKDSVAYAVNQMPNLYDEEIYVSFSHKDNGKAFTISVDQESVEDYFHVVLKDLHTGKIVDLKEQDYTFVSDASAPVQRFKMILSNDYVVPVEVTSDNLNIWFSGNAMQLDPRVEANVKSISVYNMAGQLVSTGSKAADIKVDDFGVFVVQILTNTGDVLNQKVAK